MAAKLAEVGNYLAQRYWVVGCWGLVGKLNPNPCLILVQTSRCGREWTRQHHRYFCPSLGLSELSIVEVPSVVDPVSCSALGSYQRHKIS